MLSGKKITVWKFMRKSYLLQGQWQKVLHDQDKVCNQFSIFLLNKNKLNWNQLTLIISISTDAIIKLKASSIWKYTQLFQVAHAKFVIFSQELSAFWVVGLRGWSVFQRALTQPFSLGDGNNARLNVVSFGYVGQVKWMGSPLWGKIENLILGRKMKY